MHERNDDYICLVLLETRIGKRRFINSITKSSEINGNNNCCKTSPTKACTKKFQLSRTNYGFALYLLYLFYLYLNFFPFFLSTFFFSSFGGIFILFFK